MQSPPNELVPMPAPVGRVPQPTLPFVPPLWRRIDWGRRGRDAAYVAIEFVGWALGTILILLGCVVAMFLVFSHGQLDVFFAHVDNFASRFMSAEANRRAVMEHQLAQAFVLAVATLAALRGPSFARRLRRDLGSKVPA